MSKLIAGTNRLYIDANVLIYFVEGAHQDLEEAARRAFSYAHAAGITLVTSTLTLTECLYGVHIRSDAELASDYQSVLQGGTFELVPVDEDIAENAAAIGVTLGMKLVDATHVATARAVGCDAILTNDDGMSAPKGCELYGLLS